MFEADYYWMYTDGWGGSAQSTSNAGCTSATSSGCWEHRDIVLYPFSSCAGGAAPILSMGAAYGTAGASGSLAAIMVSTCGAPPSDVTLSWSQITTLATMQQKVVGIAELPSGLGYWVASSDGAVSVFGSAANLGSMAGQSLNSPIVAIAATPDGGGYWLVEQTVASSVSAMRNSTAAPGHCASTSPSSASPPPPTGAATGW